jgi:hypothetical protein
MSGLACAGVLLAACGGGGGSGAAGGAANAFCHAIGSGSNTSCSAPVQDCANSFDGNLDTFALLDAGGASTLTGTAAAQTPGSVAGVYFVAPTTGTLSIHLTTLLDGVPQETMTAAAVRNFDAGSDTGCSGDGGVCDWNTGAASFVGFETSQDYDGIQAAVSIAGIEGLEIHELCVR